MPQDSLGNELGFGDWVSVTQGTTAWVARISFLDTGQAKVLWIDMEGVQNDTISYSGLTLLRRSDGTDPPLVGDPPGQDYFPSTTKLASVARDRSFAAREADDAGVANLWWEVFEAAKRLAAAGE